MKRKVIAIHGKMGSGKSTLAKNLFSHFMQGEDRGWCIYPFAKTLKEIVCKIGFPGYDLGGVDKTSYSPILGMKFGESLQKVGMSMRETLGENVWIKSWEYRAGLYRGVIVDDLRMKNELEHLKYNSQYYDVFLIKISDPTYPQKNGIADDGRDKNHETERGLMDHHFDAVLPYRPFREDVSKLLEKMKACGFLDSECAC